MKMTFAAIENDTVELAILRNPKLDTEVVQYLTSSLSGSHFYPGIMLVVKNLRHKLQTPSMLGSVQVRR